MFDQCRVCAKCHLEADGLNLFVKTTNSLRTLNRLKAITGVDLKKHKNMPSFMCAECQTRLEEAFKFRTDCKRAQTIMRTRIKGKKTNKTKSHSKSNWWISDAGSDGGANVDNTDVRLTEIDALSTNTGDSIGPRSYTAEQLQEEPSLMPELDIKPVVFESVKIKTEIESNAKYNLRQKEGHSHIDALDDDEKPIALAAIKQKPSSDVDSNAGSEYSVEPLAAQVLDEILCKSDSSIEDTSDEEWAADTHAKIGIKKKKPKVYGDRDSSNDSRSTIIDEENKKESEVKSKKRGRKKKLRDGKPVEKSARCICEMCGKSYSAQHYLVAHMNLHNGLTPYACETCPAKFHSERNLKRHMMKHSGARPYPCRFCDRRYLDYYARMRHERMHTNERPAKCTYCEKAFTTNHMLKNHLLTHTGERAFSCKICQRAFQQKKHLVTHYKSTFHKQNEEKANALTAQLQLDLCK